MCHFAMGLTHCYKTTVFTFIIIIRAFRERKLRQGQNLIRDSNVDFRIDPDQDPDICGSLLKCIGFILLSARVTSSSIVKIGR